MYPQQQQLPQPQFLANICYNQVDQSSFNGNLPAGNDKFPQVQQTQWLQNPQAMQLLATAIGGFRLRLQERSTRSGLHTWAYNQISQNGFNNQTWANWCNTLAGFLEFIIVVQAQNNPPQVAVPKAADTIFKCYLAFCVAQQPQLMQLVANDQGMTSELGKYSQMYGAITQDIQAYRSGRMSQPQQQMYPQQGMLPNGQIVSMGQPGNGQLPAINASGNYYQPQQQPMPLASMAVGQQSSYAVAPLPVATSTGAGNTGMDYGGPVAEPLPTVAAQPTQQPLVTPALNPVESYGVSIVETTQPVVHNPINVEELDRPVPLSAADVILDPHYYIPQGAVIDEERPFDTIYSPGGVITRPAYQVPDWKVTRNDHFVYTQMVDPERFIRFYTKWPDGVVQENIVGITDMMDYLKHEIDADLRRGATYEEGEVRLTTLKVHKTIADMQPIDEIKKLPVRDAETPVNVTLELQGTTDMENEVEARNYVRAELGLDKTQTMPSYEYTSVRTHLVDIDDDAFDSLLTALDSNDLQQFAKDLALMNRQSILESRVFNFINQRVTTEINTYLRDAMSQEVHIDNYVSDINELFDYLNTDVGEKYVKLLREGTATILARAVQLSRIVDDETKEIRYSINDRYVNLQTGWLLAELTDGKLSDEPQLVSNYTHQALIEAIKGMYSRADAAGRILNRFRVLTLDGAYLEIFKGVLVKSAFMFRRVS